MFPQTAFHKNPTIPKQTTFTPLHPRPTFSHTRQASTIPIEMSPQVNVHPVGTAFLRGPAPRYRMPLRRHRRAFSWTMGGLFFVGGLICFVCSLSMAGMSAQTESSSVNADMGVKIAASVLGGIGIGALIGGMTHLIWLYQTRKSARSDGNLESGLIDYPTTSERHERHENRLNRAGRVLSVLGRESSKRLESRRNNLNKELNFFSHDRGRTRKRRAQRQGRALSGSLTGSLASLTPPDPSHTHAAFEHTPERGSLDEERPPGDGISRMNSVGTSILNLGIEDNDQDATRKPHGDSEKHKNTQSHKIKVKPIHSNAGPVQQQQYHRERSPYIVAPCDPMPDQVRASQRAQRETTQCRKAGRDYERRSSPVVEDADVEEHGDERIQNFIQYTTILERLVQGNMESQRCTPPSLLQYQPQVSHVPQAKFRASVNIASALSSTQSQLSNSTVKTGKAKAKPVEINEALFSQPINDFAEPATKIHDRRKTRPAAPFRPLHRLHHRPFPKCPHVKDHQYFSTSSQTHPSPPLLLRCEPPPHRPLPSLSPHTNRRPPPAHRARPQTISWAQK